MKWYEYISIVLVVGISSVGGYALWNRNFANKSDTKESIPNEPFAAGSIDIRREDGSEGSPYSATSKTDDSTSLGNKQEITIPLDTTKEFVQRIDPSVKEVKLTSPLIYIKEDGSAVIDAMQELIVDRTGADTVQKIVYVDKEGNRYNSEQELLDAFIRQSSAEGLAAKPEDVYDTITGIREGKPINVTNFLTSRPEGFPAAKPDAISPGFQSRATALQKTLTVDNPGSSSNAGIVNFSRLAAIGTDLSEVDLYSVRNKNFQGYIKSGQGPLTYDQKVKLDQFRLSIDPRNMTSTDFSIMEKNKQTSAAAKATLQQRANELTKAGFREENAKAGLANAGIKVNGGLTALQLARIEQSLGRGVVKACLTCQVKTNTPPPLSTASKSLESKRQQFLRQTGRKDFSNLTPAELFAWNKLIGA